MELETKNLNIMDGFIKKYKTYDIDFFLEKLKKNIPFSYSRFNDGELLCVIKNMENNKYNITHNNNCDGHNYFPKMAKELIKTLENSDCENYFIQFLSSWIKNLSYKEYLNFLIKNNKVTGVYLKDDFLRLNFYNSPEKIKNFIDCVNNYNLILVGPNYLKKASFLKYNHFVEVPTTNCYLKKEEIIKNIEKILDNNNNNNCVVLFSSSMATNVFIDELHLKYKGKNFLIDCGSLWDIFFIDINKGIKQRSGGIKRIEMLKQNYKEFFIK